jgi:hypothetical protein
MAFVSYRTSLRKILEGRNYSTYNPYLTFLDLYIFRVKIWMIISVSIFHFMALITFIYTES